MQLIPVATKMVILQPNIGVGQGIIPSSAEGAVIGRSRLILRTCTYDCLTEGPMEGKSSIVN
jgi:hypothetical protein